ncbi:hypothetical protein chiPu_0017247 [Chiloscyllium punctatum]|uniref:Uncharacterized protein n=1 Tax=Chiloscyllium punctatum TaxID=137246 RepID=A0A401T7T9_CHIPU|nr:hypothetical protein [Chiloscyllium punctatum]
MQKHRAEQSAVERMQEDEDASRDWRSQIRIVDISILEMEEEEMEEEMELEMEVEEDVEEEEMEEEEVEMEEEVMEEEEEEMEEEMEMEEVAMEGGGTDYYIETAI